MSGRFELLEHTADIGLHLTGDSPADVLEAAGEGLAHLEGAWFPGEGTDRAVRLSAADLPALLVSWLDELLYLRDAEDAVFGGFSVDEVTGADVHARVRVAARGQRVLDSIGVKAATYHGLRFERANGAWVADVYLDV
ncbi:MAG TPA: archease [Actinomycetota bacterium]|nr:archease [Actinomycetota bacterium]